MSEKTDKADKAKADKATTETTDAATKAAATKVVDAAADAIKTAAASSEKAEPANDGSMDRTPTETQIVSPQAFPNVVEDVQAPKLVRHDTPPGVAKGAADPTTIVEEVRMVEDGQLSGDEEKDDQTLRVLAHSQGMNQATPSGDVMLQDGEKITVDKGAISDEAKESVKGK